MYAEWVADGQINIQEAIKLMVTPQLSLFKCNQKLVFGSYSVLHALSYLIFWRDEET